MSSQHKPQMNFLINRRYADYRHGTGVQIKLFAGQLIEKPLHICWDDGRSVKDTYQPVCNLNTSLLKVWPFRRGRGLVVRMEAKLGLTWGDSSRIAKRVKQFATAKTGKSRAYVIIASEEEAHIARRILDILDAEYVVNVMDYLHLGCAELSKFPHFAAILKRAKKIFALTPPIQMTLEKISGRKDISILGVAREPVRKQPREFIPGTRPFEIVMMGSVDYTRGIRELHNFCKGLDDIGLKYSLNYIGTQEMRNRLGTQLPVNYHGVRLGAERDAILNSTHLAYLPGPDGDPAEDYLARFSFPSRLTDYFWHGLPVIGPLFEDSATAQMLGGLAGKGAWFSQDSKQLVAVVKNLAQKPQEWKSASEAAYDFAQKNFSIKRTAAEILEAFDN
jgi:glycosyltransferase involved in cell wall biosynthesis